MPADFFDAIPDEPMAEADGTGADGLPADFFGNAAKPAAEQSKPGMC